MNKAWDNPLIEKAIKFLAKKIDTYSVNLKPVVYHSVRVGILLADHGYGNDIVIGGILHDVCEDAWVSFDEIRMEFWNEIGNIVQANTFNLLSQDKKMQYMDCFERCKNGGFAPLIVKAADIYENSFYYHLAKDAPSFLGLIEKLESFLDISQEVIGAERLYSLLQSQYMSLKNNFNIVFSGR